MGCNFCPQTYIAHPTRQRLHLKACTNYLKTLPKDDSKQTNIGGFDDPAVAKNFPRLTRDEKHDLDLRAALSCFMGSHAFNMYENSYTKDFLHRLNPAYKPPSRMTIAGPLLDEVYSAIKARTDVLISSLDGINVITDESSNINTNRIANISVHSRYGALHYVSENIRAKRMTASAAAQWLRNHLLALSNNRLDCINSISNDTCSTMRGMWAEIEKFEDLRHCLFIPCDSHGIQLLVKDLLNLPYFNEIIQKAQCIVKSFRHAPLQYGRLREFQVQYYRNPQSLVLSVITRWGTQYRLVTSLLKNKDAIKRYALEVEPLPTSERLKQIALDAIIDKDVWVGLEALRELLQPIDERLRMSESGKSHLGHVLHRWADILKHLKAESIEHDELASFVNNGAFTDRYNRQVLPIHIVAYYLMPETTVNDIAHNTPIPLGFEMQITAFFRRYSSSEDEADLVIQQFMCFRAQEAPFEPLRQCWEGYKNVSLFWSNAVALAKSLGTIARRIFSAPVNSVASERAFSVQNLIHNRTRNRLHPERTDKLAFIYTNGRVLDQQKIAPNATIDFVSKVIDNLTPEEEVRLEDILLELAEDRDVAVDQNEFQDYDDEERCGGSGDES